jgi:hypothetical protein
MRLTRKTVAPPNWTRRPEATRACDLIAGGGALRFRPGHDPVFDTARVSPPYNSSRYRRLETVAGGFAVLEPLADRLDRSLRTAGGLAIE